MVNTKQKVMSNLIWRFAERCGAQFVTFVVSIVLARILGPEHYGTVALVTVITTLLQVFVDSGLGNALIQKKDADDIDFSTVFFTNIVFCTIIYVVLFLISPIVAKFYNNMELVPYIRVLGITILISGIKNVQQAYVSKNMMFKRFFFATLGGTITAGIVGIIMAVCGFGVWAIIAQHLINLSIDTIILWITVKWRPKRKFSLERLKKLYSFGWKLLVSSILDTVYKDLRQLIIGKKYTSSDLAYYNKANQFPNLIVNNVNSSINSVLLPAMSQVQDNKVRVKEMTRKSIKTSVYIMAPLMIGLAATSNSVVAILLGEKWMQCIPFLMILSIDYMFYPIHTANLNAIKAMGRSDLFLKLEIIKKAIGLGLLFVTMNISVFAMAVSQLISGIFSQIINAWPNKKLLDYSYLQQLKDIIPSILLSVIMGGIVFLINFIPVNVIIKLAVQVIIGGVIYIFGSFILKIDTFTFILDTLKGFRKKTVKEN